VSEATVSFRSTSTVPGNDHDDLRHQIVIIASMYSFLKGLGIDSPEIRDHLYDLLSEWVSRTKYTYIDGLIELSAHKNREVSDLVNIYGEDGLEIILEILEDEACKMEKEEENLRALLEDLEVCSNAAKRILELAKSKGCLGIRSASIALLITPKRDQK